MNAVTQERNYVWMLHLAQQIHFSLWFETTVQEQDEQ